MLSERRGQQLAGCVFDSMGQVFYDGDTERKVVQDRTERIVGELSR